MQQVLETLCPAIGKPFSRSAILLLCIGLSSCVIPAVACAGTTIVIDAGKRLAQSEGGDDLAAARNMFQGANAPSERWADPQRSSLKPVLSDLKMKQLRFLQNDSLCDLDANGQLGSVTIVGTNTDGAYKFGPVKSGGCDLLDWTFPWSFESGLSLHVAVGSFMPPSFARGFTSAETWGSTNRYKLYAERLVRYILDKAFNAGARSVIFEVSNELDGADNTPQNWSTTQPSAYKLAPLGPFGRWLWWINPASYNLGQWPPYQASTFPYVNGGLGYPYGFDMRRLDHGILPVQKIFAEAINKVRTELAREGRFLGRSVEIAGPAFTSRSFLYFPKSGRPTLEEVFLEQTLRPNAAFHAPLDRFSFHYYGTLDHVADPSKPFALFRQVVTTVRSKLAALGHPEIKLFVSEWGPSLGEDDDINYSHKGAAWAAAFLNEAVAQNISMGSYLMLEDGSGDPRVASYLSQASLMHKYIDSRTGAVHYYPKPAANVFRMFTMMTGARLAATLSPAGGHTHLGAFAATDLQAGTAGVLVFNYAPNLVFDTKKTAGPDAAESFTVEIDNLPVADGMVTVQRYLVDANTSNLSAFLFHADHPDPNLRMVEQFTAAIVGGKIVLPARSLGLGVSFWRVQGLPPPSAAKVVEAVQTLPRPGLPGLAQSAGSIVVPARSVPVR